MKNLKKKLRQVFLPILISSIISVFIIMLFRWTICNYLGLFDYSSKLIALFTFILLIPVYLMIDMAMDTVEISFLKFKVDIFPTFFIVVMLGVSIYFYESAMEIVHHLSPANKSFEVEKNSNIFWGTIWLGAANLICFIIAIFFSELKTS